MPEPGVADPVGGDLPLMKMEVLHHLHQLTSVPFNRKYGILWEFYIMHGVKLDSASGSEWDDEFTKIIA